MRYYIFINGQQIGPMTSEQMQYYNVNSDTQVRDENSSEWRALLFYPDLMQLYGPSASRNVIPGQQSYSQPVQSCQPQPYTINPPQGYKKSSNAWVWWIVGIVVGLPLLFFILYFLLMVLAFSL